MWNIWYLMLHSILKNDVATSAKNEICEIFCLIFMLRVADIARKNSCIWPAFLHSIETKGKLSIFVSLDVIGLNNFFSLRLKTLARKKKQRAHFEHDVSATGKGHFYAFAYSFILLAWAKALRATWNVKRKSVTPSLCEREKKSRGICAHKRL